MLSFWTSLAEEIGTPVLVGTILSKSDYEVDLFKEFVIVNGILGAIDGGWTHETITNMITQILLSLAVTWLSLEHSASTILPIPTSPPCRKSTWQAVLWPLFLLMLYGSGSRSLLHLVSAKWLLFVRNYIHCSLGCHHTPLRQIKAITRNFYPLDTARKQIKGLFPAWFFAFWR